MARPTIYRSRAAGRHGLSILEVMFAIGIAIVGLLGIAAMLPLAGRNASESVRVAEAQALAHAWNDDLMVQGLYEPTRWAFFHDFNGGGTAFGWRTFATELPNFSVALPTQRNTIGGAIGNSQRVTSKQAVCIDPYFLTSRDLKTKLAAGQFVAGAASNNYYRPTVFPYYIDTYNPIIDPVYTRGSGSQSSFEFTLDQPRMVRVTFGNEFSRQSFKAIQNLFTSSDDLSITTEATDRSVPATRTMVNTGASTYLKMAADGNYSWIATIVPTDTLLNTDFVDKALLSVVVIHRRDMLFMDPSSPLSRGSDADTENKPNGERLFHVVPQFSGGTPVPFRGGHGGSVRFVASDGVSSRMHVGDWVMLAKNLIIAGTTPPQTLPIFRWYRIIAVEGDENTSTLFSPGNSTAPDRCWERQVVLDGPDWTFDAQPTSATYIPGAVAVYERIIER